MINVTEVNQKLSITAEMQLLKLKNINIHKIIISLPYNKNINNKSYRNKVCTTNLVSVDDVCLY